MPITIDEGQTATMRITRNNADNSAAETVNITNPLPGQLDVPAVATFAPGANFVDVIVTGVADGVADADAVVGLTVGGSGYAEVSDNVTVNNVDVKTLTLSFI